ncbi:MAG: hypothetical protein MMC33_002827 [Icmadophila ericetorum]|nr:hypothetical protein [Icmadophila ericetorum]
MSTQYDRIAHQYELINNLPHLKVCVSTTRRTLGNVTGLQILDLACGTGYHSNLLLDWGAASVTGIDISPGMIEAAKAKLTKGPYGSDRLKYHVGDATDPNLLRNAGLSDKKFDLVHGAWLLNYAASDSSLTAMWRNIASALKPGGRFVGLVPNILDAEFGFEKPFQVEKYGAIYEAIGKVEGGWKVRVIGLTDPEPRVEFECLILNAKDGEGRSLYERCAAEAGMREVKFVSVGPGEEELGEYEEGFWEEYVRRPYALVCIAVR